MARKTLFAILSFVFLSFFITSSFCFAEDEVLRYSEIITKLESLKGEKIINKEASYDVVSGTGTPEYTDLQDQYHMTIKGKLTTGEGIVVNTLISSRSGRTKITILSPGSVPIKGYNAVLITSQDDVQKLKKGDRVSFKGRIGNKSNWRGVSLDIVGTFGLIKK